MTQEKDGGISKVKLALGAASLFFFLVGLKRSFRRDDGSEILSNGELSPGKPTKSDRLRASLRSAN